MDMENRTGFDTSAIAAVQAMLAAGVESDADLVALTSGLERLKNWAAATQARAALELRQVREAETRARGGRSHTVAAAVAAEIALARQESPHRGSRLLELAWVLNAELPHTLRLFTAGDVSEYRASLVARETACLARADRARVDEALAVDLAALSNRQLVAQARRLAYDLDPHSVVARNARAETARRVTLRPAADCMAHLSALLPMAEGVAVFAHLTRAATQARSQGDPRSKGQVMADTLVERVTGRAVAGQVSVEVRLVMTDAALLGGSDTTAHADGYGPVPAPIARRLAATAAATDGAWIRRLYTEPGSGKLVAMESQSRRFSPGMKRFLAVRDAWCRTPWCGAPIRHADHVIPVNAGGVTSIANGQGLCERCNQVKESPGWYARPGPDDTITLRTPTGHRYHSSARSIPHELPEPWSPWPVPPSTDDLWPPWQPPPGEEDPDDLQGEVLNDHDWAIRQGDVFDLSEWWPAA